jgi:hypothetical protein
MLKEERRDWRVRRCWAPHCSPAILPVAGLRFVALVLFFALGWVGLIWYCYRSWEEELFDFSEGVYWSRVHVSNSGF